MPNQTAESPSGHESRWNADDRPRFREHEQGEVLVVGRSQINRVVVAKIVERSGLKHQSAMPEEAGSKLAAMRPGLVILDGGADNHDCDGLMASLVDQRRVSDRNAPFVILLSNRTGIPSDLQLGSPVDAVVAKPITPESLQPVVDRLLSRAVG